MNLQYRSLNDFLDAVAFDMWVKDRQATLFLTGKSYRSAVDITKMFEWKYAGKTERAYKDGFSFSHEDRLQEGELRSVQSELKDAENVLIKKGVVSIPLEKGSGLHLGVINCFPTGCAADLLNVAECRLVKYGKELTARKLFELAGDFGRSDRQIYSAICDYFSNTKA
jgi:hypothetical protein